MFTVTLTLLSPDRSQSLQVARHEFQCADNAKMGAALVAENMQRLEMGNPYSVTAWDAEGYALACFGN
jgi:hypothetical protein